MQNSRFLRDSLQQHNIQCMLNQYSSTVVFERPKNHEFIRKWQLACEGSIAHVVVMPSVSEDKLRTFVADLMQFGMSESPGSPSK